MIRRKHFLSSGFPTLLGVLLGLGQLHFTSFGAAEVAKNLRPAVDAAIDKVRPALVRIRVVSTVFAEGR